MSPQRQGIGSRAYGRTLVGLTDQAVSAIGNVAMSLGVASQLTAGDFGRFSLVFACYLVAVGLSRAINSEPMVVLASGEAPVSGAGGRHGASLAGALVAGVGLAALLAAGGLVFQAPFIWAVLLPLPLLLMQDAVRNALLVDARPGSALFNDGVWTLLQLAGLFVLIRVHAGELWQYLATWGLAGAVAGLIGLWQLRTRPRISILLDQLRAQKELSRRYALEYLSGAGALQLVNLAIATFVGVTALGAIRGAQVILGPFNQLLTGLTLVAMPEMVRLASRDLSRLPKVSLLLAGGMASVVLAGTFLLLFMPESIGEALLGDTWSSSRGLLIPVGVTIAGNMFTLGALLGLRALADPHASLRGRLASVTLLLGIAMTTIVVTHSTWAIAWSITVSVWLATIVWWRLFRASFVLHTKAIEGAA